MCGLLAGEVVDRYGTSLAMSADQVCGGIPDDNVRNAGLLTKIRLGEIGGNEMLIDRPRLGCIAILIDDERGKERFPGHGFFLSWIKRVAVLAG